MQNEKERASYTEVLNRFHATLRPRTYLEIGTGTGTSLELSKCASIAIDPGFRLERDVLKGKPCCLLFQMTSDAFFAEYSPSSLFGKPVDMAFLDGMHYAEFLLRDFINVEPHLKKNSVLMLHDCIPGNIEMTSRTIQQGVAWTGDVWKVVIVLKKYRPDMRIQAFDSPPTGLIVCTNLDPKSRLLSDNYFTILGDFAALDLATVGIKSYQELVGMTGTEATKTFEGLTRDYWL
jgi:hypothetical protein